MKIMTYDDVDPTAVYRLTSMAFGWGLTESHVRRERREDPRCFEEFGFYAVEDGRPLAQVIPFRMRIRLATGVETIGAIAGVCSHPSVWGLGYARKTMERAHEWFQGEGFRIAALTTSRNIRGFGIYRKMGYVDLGPFYRAYRLLPKERPRPKGIRFRQARRTDLALLQRFFETHTRGLLGWTVRGLGEFRAKMAWGHRLLERVRIVLRDGKPVGYFRSRPDEQVLIREAILPRIEDFRATVALLEARSRGKVATADWITSRKDQERFRALGYTLDSPDPGTSMAFSLDGRLEDADLLAAFGVTAGTFVHHPTENF